MDEALSLVVPAPSPDQDAGALYAQIASKREDSDLEAWLTQDETPDPAAPGASPDAGAADGYIAPDDPALGPAGALPAAPVSAPDTAEPARAGVPGDGSDGWTLGDAVKGLYSVASDVVPGLAESPKQAVGGVIDALGEFDQWMQSVLPIGGAELFDDDGNFSPSFVSNEEMMAAEKAGEDLFSMVAPDPADTVTGGFVRSTSQFLTGFIPAAAAVAAAAPALGSVGVASVAGAMADAVVFDPHQERLSTFLNQVPALEAIVPDYLADNDPANEAAWQGRLKNAAEGLGLGLMTDGLLRTFKYYKAQKAANAQNAALVNPIGAKVEAAKDQMKAAARDELEIDIPDEAVAPLGDASPNAPLLIEAKPNETLVQATGRLREAEARAALSVENQDALNKVAAIRQKFAERSSPEAAAAGRDPMDDMLDELRSGAASAAKLPARPVSAIIKEMGGIDPSSSIAGDLRSRGITAKSFPGLFSKKGRKKITPQGDFSTPSLRALDNIPASEHPIFADRGLVGDDGYIPQQSWIDGLEAELRGEPWRDVEQQKLFDDVIGPIDELDQSLSRLGIDYENMSNESVKARIKQIDDEEAAFRRGDNIPPADQVDQPHGLEPEEIAAREAAGIEAPRAPDLPDNTQAPGKIYINHARINSADDVKAVLQQMADMDEAAIDAKRGGKVVSNDKTIAKSAQEYRDLNDLIGREPGPMTAAKAVAARRLLVSSGEQLVQLSKAASAATATPADIYNFRRAMAVHYAIQSEVVAARTETARALQSWSIPIGATKARTQAINDLIAQGGGTKDIQALAKAVSGMADNPTGINVVAQQLGRSRFGAAAYQVWINGLLSGPRTHMVNMLSNSAVAVWAIPERYVAAGISKAFYGGEIQAGETAAQAFGLVKGIRDGVRLAWHGANADGMSELSDVFDAFVKSEQSHGNAISAEAFGLKSEGGFGYGIDMLGKFINAPGSALQAEDKFFKTIGYRMELQALAYRKAAGEGLEGKELAGRIVDIVNNPPEDLAADAMATAHYQTFTNSLGQTGKMVQLAIARIPGAKIVVPFVKTPTNIMKYTFARTPLAYMSGAIRADIAAGGARAASAHARVALGTMVMLTIADMTMDGGIVGGGPLDPNVRKAWLDEGNVPYSIKIGDRNYQYSRADPIGMMMGLAADMATVLANTDEEDGGKLVTAGAVAIASNLANKTYMSGIFDFIGAIDPSNPSKNFGKYLADQAGGLVPYSSFLRSISQAMDPINRDAQGVVVALDDDGNATEKADPVASYLSTLVNSVKKGIPGMSDTLPAMKDLWGQEITRASGLGWPIDALSPIASRADDPDPVDRVIVENRISVSAAPRQIEGVTLTPEQYSEFVTLAGEPAKAALDELIKSPLFKQAGDGPDGLKAEIVKDVINSNRERAKAIMMQRHSDLRERMFYKERAKALKFTGQ